MAKKLKTYETSLGFFDLAIAAPSMKAALEAWGADSDLFHQGAAKQSEDMDVVAATMAKPGVMLPCEAIKGRSRDATGLSFRYRAECARVLIRGMPQIIFVATVARFMPIDREIWILF